MVHLYHSQLSTAHHITACMQSIDCSFMAPQILLFIIYTPEVLYRDDAGRFVLKM